MCDVVIRGKGWRQSDLDTAVVGRALKEGMTLPVEAVRVFVKGCDDFGEPKTALTRDDRGALLALRDAAVEYLSQVWRKPAIVDVIHGGLVVWCGMCEVDIL